MHKKNICIIAFISLIVMAVLTHTASARAQVISAGDPREPIEHRADPNRPLLLASTSTPNEDGSIAHVIKYGETLIEIAEAYGVPLADLISMNKLDPNNPAYFEGQVLLIRVAFTETPFMTTTFTPRPPTRTSLPTRTPRPTRTATEQLSPTSARTPTREPLVRVPTIEEIGPARPILAYAAFGISLIALVALAFSFFFKDNGR